MRRSEAAPKPLAPTDQSLARERAVRQPPSMLRMFFAQRNGVIGLVIVTTVVLLTVLGDWIVPHDPFAQNLIDRLRPPFWLEGGSTAHLLGTDVLGRDILSRLIFASRWSILVGFLAVVIALGIGVPFGLLAGYFGRYVDASMTFSVNVVMAFPFIVFALTVIAFLGPGFVNLILVLGLAGWVVYARVVRTETLSLREREFVIASRALGAGHARIIWKHLLPIAADSVLILASTQVAAMILAEAFLSFLGFGIQPPTPSWGSMLAEARSHMFARWWLAAWPGIAIFIMVFGVNLLADGFRDVLDPRTRR